MTEGHEQAAGTAQRLSARQVELIVRRMESLPTLPGVVAAVSALAETADPDGNIPSTAGAGKIISCDPSLTAALLRTANAQTPRARTLAEAIAVLPAEQVWSAAVAAAMFDPEGESNPFDRVGFWTHSLAAACAAASLAADSGITDPELAFTCGLLHDIGKLVLSEQLPKSYARVVELAATHRGDISQFERAVIGIDHAAAGRCLAEHWRLGKVVQDCIWMCHQPLEAIPARMPHARTVALVTCADTLVRELHIGFSGTESTTRSASERAQRLGISSADLQRAREQLPGQVRRRLAEMGLNVPQDAARHAEALARSRRALATINDSLSRRLQWADHHATAMDTFSGILSAMEQQSVWEFLGAATDALSTGSDAAIAYVVDAETGELLAVRSDGTRRTEHVAACPAAAGNPGEQTPDDQTLVALLTEDQTLADWLAESPEIRHRRLQTGGQWIGGFMAAAVDGPVVDTLTALLEPVLALILDKSRAVDLSDQLAGSSQLLAATQDALAEARTLAAVGEMAAGAAHELNNPLAVVSGRAQLMGDKADTPEQRDTWRLIAEQADRISSIITELMDYASPPEPVRESVDVAELIDQSVEAFKSSGHAKAQNVRVDIVSGLHASAVLVDREQMREVIAELIANAATAADPDAEPVIRISARDEELADTVLLSVEDNGPGMDEDTLQRAFTPFFSLQQAGRRRGLGLPRAKRYVEIGGGKIWIRPGRGNGLSVYLQLPRAL